MSKNSMSFSAKFFMSKKTITTETEINTPFLHYPKETPSNTNKLADHAQSSKNFPHKILIPYP